MTMEDRARLSFFQELAPVGSRANVMLVMHIQTKKLYVKKTLQDYNRAVYEVIREEKNIHFPEIVELVKDDCLYLVEEYVDGETLEGFVQNRGVLSLAEAIQAMRDICDGVLFLHGQNPPIIHRDLKPSNIMRDKDGVWKIIDVNTARLYDIDATRDTEYLGTKGFAAPEQFGFQQTDVRTDIYALGILFNYMLTGTSPVEKVCAGAAGRIVQKCIMFEPGRRYQTVGELLSAIMALREPGEDLSPGSEGTTTAFAGCGDHISKKSDGKNIYPVLPPGFRSLTPWKMLLGAIGYLLIIWICVTLEVKNGDGLPATGFELVANRVAAFLWIFLTILLGGNYLGVQKKLPLTKSRNIFVRFIGIVLYAILIFILDVTILLILCG